MTQSPPQPHRALATDPEEKGWSAALVGRLLILVFAAEFSFFTYAFPTGVVPLVATEFQTDQAIWIVSAYAIGSAAFAPLLGRLGDRIGKRRVLLIMMAAGILGAVVVTFAPTFGLVIAGRVLQGMSLGIPFMNASLVRDIFPRSTMTVATALVVTGSGLLSIPTSLALGPIIEGLGWRGVIWVPAAYAVVVTVLLVLFVPESPLRARGERFDVLGAALLAGAVTCLLVPISFGLVWGWTSPQSLGFFAASLVLFVVWIIQARRTTSPVIAIRDFTYPPLAITFVLAFVGLAVGTAIYTLWGYVIATPASAGLGYGLGLRPSDIAMFTAVFSVGSFVGGFVTGRLLRTVWPGPVAMAVFAICALGYTVTAFGLSSAVQFGIGVLILAFSSGSGYALFYNLVAQTVSPQRQASTAAAVTVGMNIGGAILPVVIIAILNSTAAFADGAPVYTADGVRLVFLLPAALALVLVAVGAALTAYQRRHGGRLREAVAMDPAVPPSA